MTVPHTTTERNPAAGTWYVAPSWISDTQDGGYGYWRSVSVATGETIAENDDLSALVAFMAAQHPHLRLIENAYSLNAGVAR
jgi:hypothetical protein